MQTSRMLVRNQVCRITIWCVFNKPCLERTPVPLLIFLSHQGSRVFVGFCNGSFLCWEMAEPKLRPALVVRKRSVVMRGVGISFLTQCCVLEVAA